MRRRIGIGAPATAMVIVTTVTIINLDYLYAVFHEQEMQLLLELDRYGLLARSALYVADWKNSICMAARDIVTMLQSSSKAVYLTVYPVAWLLVVLCQIVLQAFYEYVLVRGILSETALRHMQRRWRQLVVWQMARSPQEVAIEFGIFVGAIGMYRFARFLQRRQYGMRLRRKVSRVRQTIYQSYNRLLFQISRTSRWLAIMTPHAVLAGTAVAVKVMFPSACVWLAQETQLMTMASHWLPLVVSICILYDASYKKMSKNSLIHCQDQSATTATTTTTSLHHQAKRSKHAKDENEENITQRHQYWLHYWMVCASLTALQRLLRALPLSTRFLPFWFTSGLVQLQLLFWIWINVAPLMTPSSLRTELPVDWLAKRCIEPVTNFIYNTTSSLVQKDLWETYVCVPAKKILAMFVWSKFVTENQAVAWAHMLKECRGLILPALAICSWPIQVYGLLYIQFLFPLARSSNTNNHSHWLQFWVLHCCVTAVVNLFASILWWIPLSTAVLFLFYAWLGTVTPERMESIYEDCVQREMQALGFLPTFEDENKLVTVKTESSKTARALSWILDRLPSAADVHRNKSEATTNKELSHNNMKVQVDDKISSIRAENQIEHDGEQDEITLDGKENDSFVIAEQCTLQISSPTKDYHAYNWVMGRLSSCPYSDSVNDTPQYNSDRNDGEENKNENKEKIDSGLCTKRNDRVLSKLKTPPRRGTRRRNNQS